MNEGNRPYRETHPWISFTLDLHRLSIQTWIGLGEAQSKCDHIAKMPLNPAVAEAMHRLYLAKGVRGTTAIEGNTLSEEDILRQIDGNLHLPPSKEYQGREVQNIVEACNLIRQRVVEATGMKLTKEDLQKYNEMVLHGLDREDGVSPGQIRCHSVGIAGARYRGAPAEDCEYLLDRLCAWLNEFESPTEQDRVAYGILKAIIAHVYLAWIHPFGDGNGRTARLVEFQLLLASGAPTPAAHLLSNFYNETRAEYYRQLARSSKSATAIVSFIDYAVAGLVDALRNQLRFIWEQVWEVTWESYIHDQFKGKEKASDIRQRHLALDISRAYPTSEPMLPSNVTRVSPRVAADYARRTQRTVVRDLQVLRRMGLVVINDDGSIKPNRELIFSFLPQRCNPE